MNLSIKTNRDPNSKSDTISWTIVRKTQTSSIKKREKKRKILEQRRNRSTSRPSSPLSLPLTQVTKSVTNPIVQPPPFFQMALDAFQCRWISMRINIYSVSRGRFDVRQCGSRIGLSLEGGGANYPRSGENYSARLLLLLSSLEREKQRVPIRRASILNSAIIPDTPSPFPHPSALHTAHSLGNDDH